jgi:hypothetical protein
VTDRTLNNFFNYPKCTECTHISRRKSCTEIENTLSSFGYKLVEFSGKSSESIKVLCPKGHISNIYFFNFTRGHRCKFCVGGLHESSSELEIVDYISSIFNKEIQRRNNKLISPYELDIFIPDENLAIEFCGLIWHSEFFGKKSCDYHYNKMRMCYEKGIRLITIFGDEYYSKKDIIFNEIKCALNIYSEEVGSENCVVKHIDKSIANRFLDKIHINSSSSSTYRFGLFHNDELVQVMTFGALSRAHAGDNKTIEMKRFASKIDCLVVGGASKLFKYALSVLKEKGYTHIKSYCDMRWANPFNTIYEKLGFKLTKIKMYSFYYLINKYSKKLRTKEFIETTNICSSLIKNNKFYKELEYDRIWDCGYNLYLYTI